MLVNPAVFDVRFPWADWHQPATLLRLATILQKTKRCDVRLIDMLERTKGSGLKKEQVERLNLDGQQVARWRYGQPISRFVRALQDLSNHPWKPGVVIIECLTTFWWEGAAEAANAIRKVFPRARIALVGVYPSLAKRHALRVVQPHLLLRHPHRLADVSPAVRRGAIPDFLLVSLGGAARTAEEVAHEISRLRSAGVGQFAISMNQRPDAAKQLAMVLEKLASLGVKAKFIGLGELGARDIVAESALPSLMKRVGYREICLSDDRHIPMNSESMGQWLDSHRQAAALFVRAGFELRTRALTGSVCVGRRGEDLTERVRAIALMAHILGSVIIWPYQPESSEFPPNTPLHLQNGKLFPFRQANGYTYRDYLEVLGLAAILNSKYRDKTFDFFSNRLIPNLFRQSITNRGWEPDPSVKGTTRLPALARA